MKLFAKNVDAKRAIELASFTYSALMGCALTAVVVGSVVETSRAPGLDDLAGPREISEAGMEAHERILDHVRPIASPLSSTLSAGNACFMDLVDTSSTHAGIDERIRNSVVMLQGIFQNGERIDVALGSGTIIVGDNGERSILTAAHVTDMAAGELQELIAYNHEGLAIGSFQVSFAATSGFGAEPEDGADKIFEDIAVLHPIELYGHTGEELWQSGGLKIADQQSRSVLTAFADTSNDRSFAISKGMSGASVINAEGEVIGVMDQKLVVSEDMRQYHKGSYVNSLTNDHNLGYLSDNVLDMQEIIQDFAANTASFEDAIALALPVVNDQALMRMGYDPEDITLKRMGEDEFARAQSAGFPSASCQSMDIVINPMPDIRVSRETRTETAWIQDVPTAKVAELPYFTVGDAFAGGFDDPLANADIPVFEMEPIVVTEDPFAEIKLSLPGFLDDADLADLE
jgi:hypothetical protein